MWPVTCRRLLLSWCSRNSCKHFYARHRIVWIFRYAKHEANWFLRSQCCGCYKRYRNWYKFFIMFVFIQLLHNSLLADNAKIIRCRSETGCTFNSVSIEDNPPPVPWIECGSSSSLTQVLQHRPRHLAEWKLTGYKFWMVILTYQHKGATIHMRSDKILLRWADNSIVPPNH